jgi:hypothetical protein
MHFLCPLDSAHTKEKYDKNGKSSLGLRSRSRQCRSRQLASQGRSESLYRGDFLGAPSTPDRLAPIFRHLYSGTNTLSSG